MEVISISENEFEEKVLKADKKVFVDFYADWCGPCKMLSPVIDEIATGYDSIYFYKVNVDNAEKIARTYGIMSIPTLIIFNNGEIVNKSVGLLSKDELKLFIES